MAVEHGFKQDGYLLDYTYQIVLPQNYFDMYCAAKKQMESSSWSILADRGREFPSIVDKTSRIDLDNASAADIGTLVSYFAYVGKSPEDIFNDVKFHRLEK